MKIGNFEVKCSCGNENVRIVNRRRNGEYTVVIKCPECKSEESLN